MDYATYKKLRAYCWQDLEPYLNDPRLESTRRLNERLSEAVGLPELEHIEFEGDVAKNVFRKRDVTPRELAAAQLLSVASDNWARTYRTEPGRRRAHTYPAITPTEAADRWRKAHAAASEYAAFLPEREAAAMLAMLRDSGQATPAPVVAESASGGTVTVWTVERKADARAMMERLKGQGMRAYAARTAAAFNVTPARLRAVLNDTAKKAPAKRAAKHWPR